MGAMEGDIVSGSRVAKLRRALRALRKQRGYRRPEGGYKNEWRWFKRAWVEEGRK